MASQCDRSKTRTSDTLALGTISGTILSFLTQWGGQRSKQRCKEGSGLRLPGVVTLQMELLRALYRPLAASLASPAKSTCCSVGSLARACSSSHLQSKGFRHWYKQAPHHPQRTEYKTNPTLGIWGTGPSFPNTWKVSYLGNLIPAAKTVVPLSFSCMAGIAVLPWDLPSEMMIRILGTVKFLPPGNPLRRTYFRARPVSVLPPLETRETALQKQRSNLSYCYWIHLLIFKFPFSGSEELCIFLYVATQTVQRDV